MRYRLLALLCRVLRHPDRRETYAGGSARTRCPCGYIEIFDRPFRGAPVRISNESELDRGIRRVEALSREQMALLRLLTEFPDDREAKVRLAIVEGEIIAHAEPLTLYSMT